MTAEMATSASDAKTGTVTKQTAFQAFLTNMENLAELDTSGGGNAPNTVMAIMTAGDEQEMWEADEIDSLGGRDLVGVEQEILDFDVKFGGRDDIETVFVGPTTGRQMYILVQSVRLSKSPEVPAIAVGEQFVWNTSAPAIVAKLFWARGHSMIPGFQGVIRDTKLGGGQAVIKFKQIPERVVKASK